MYAKGHGYETGCLNQKWEQVIGDVGTNLWQCSCLELSNIGLIYTRDNLMPNSYLFIPSVNLTIENALLCHTTLLLIEAS